MGLTHNEVLTLQHFARAGKLTPGQLAALLQLSFGGTAALLQRLQQSGHISRHTSPRDRPARCCASRQQPFFRVPTDGRPSSTSSPFSSQSAKQRLLAASSNTLRTLPSAMLIDSQLTPTRAPTTHSPSRCQRSGSNGESSAKQVRVGVLHERPSAAPRGRQPQYRRRS